MGEETEDEDDTDDVVTSCLCCSYYVIKTKGGRLRHLLRYDVKCFVVSLLVLAVLGAWTWSVDSIDARKENLLRWILESPQFKEDLFWCKVLYGLLSLPFFPFMIPVFLQVLTHCEFTGYNESGACVAFDYPGIGAARPLHQNHVTLATTTLSPVRRAFTRAVDKYGTSRIPISR